MARMVTSAAEIRATVPPERQAVDPDVAKIRAWALRYHFIDARTGRLPAGIVAMYHALHPDGAA